MRSGERAGGWGVRRVRDWGDPGGGNPTRAWEGREAALRGQRGWSARGAPWAERQQRSPAAPRPERAGTGRSGGAGLSGAGGTEMETETFPAWGFLSGETSPRATEGEKQGVRRVPPAEREAVQESWPRRAALPPICASWRLQRNGEQRGSVPGAKSLRAESWGWVAALCAALGNEGSGSGCRRRFSGSPSWLMAQRRQTNLWKYAQSTWQLCELIIVTGGVTRWPKTKQIRKEPGFTAAGCASVRSCPAEGIAQWELSTKLSARTALVPAQQRSLSRAAAGDGCGVPWGRRAHPTACREGLLSFKHARETRSLPIKF